MNGNFRTFALVAAALVAVVAIVASVIKPEEAVTILGFAVTIVTILIAAAGLSAGQVQIKSNLADTDAKVDAVHDKVNGLTTQLVDTTASNSFQAGQAAGPGAPVPPVPSST